MKPTQLATEGHVLLVSRDRLLVRTLEQWCALWGLAVASVGDTEAARSRLQASPGSYQAVLLDEGELLDPAGFLAPFEAPGAPEGGPAFLLLRRDPQSRRLRGLESRFATILDLPPQKPLLFNALYAIRGELPEDDRVVDLAAHRWERQEAPTGGRVLVAEDNATNREVMRLILEKAGYEPVLVNDGEEALQALEAGAYELALVDMHMPERDGLEVIQTYRFMETGDRPLPFVLLTADVTAEAAQRAEAARVTAYLTKPLEADRLLETLERVRSGSEAGVARGPSTSRESGLGAQGPEEPGATRDGPLVSPRALHELGAMTDNPRFLAELIQEFLTNAEALREQMEQAVQEGRLDELREHAHALKGSASNLGVQAVANVCERLQFARSVDLAAGTVRYELAWLADLLKRTRPALLVHASGRLQR